nr:MAG TPA: hypothetical protein [Caudoviricetes sp.]
MGIIIPHCFYYVNNNLHVRPQNVNKMRHLFLCNIEKQANLG